MLALAMSGHIDKRIAAEMGISLGTVRVYWKRIRTKVGGTRSEVIAELARNSLKLNFEEERDRSERMAETIEALTARDGLLRVYETAFASLPEAFALLDAPTGRVLAANPAFAAMHGYDEGELVGASDLAIVSQGDPSQTPSTRVRKDGTTFAAHVRTTGDDAVRVLLVEPALA